MIPITKKRPNSCTILIEKKSVCSISRLGNPINNNIKIDRYTTLLILSLMLKNMNTYEKTNNIKLACTNQKNGITISAPKNTLRYNPYIESSISSSAAPFINARGTKVTNVNTRYGNNSLRILENTNLDGTGRRFVKMTVYAIRNPDTKTNVAILKLCIILYISMSFPLAPSGYS